MMCHSITSHIPWLPIQPGIYAWAQTQDNFEEAYISLLRDTANMTTEELASTSC